MTESQILENTALLALTKDQSDPDSNDYLMDPNAESAWITVNNVSIYVRQTDESVTVSLFPKGREDDSPLDVAHTNYADIVMDDGEENDSMHP